MRFQTMVVTDQRQLPPVIVNNPVKTEGTDYIFESKEFREMKFHCYWLKEVFRQRDSRFLTLLDEARECNMGTEARMILQAASRKPLTDEARQRMVFLHPHRETARVGNAKRNDMLTGVATKFTAVDTIYDNEIKSEIKDRVELELERLEREIELKVGSVVMTNHTSGPFKNSTPGVVTGFTPENNPISNQ